MFRRDLGECSVTGSQPFFQNRVVLCDIGSRPAFWAIDLRVI
jgi:hypothetical protein